MTEKRYDSSIQKLIYKFQDVPFVHNGRSLEKGLDCLGFVTLFLNEFGISLPYDDGDIIEKDWYRKDPNRFIRGLEGLQGTAVSIDELQPLDLIYFAINRNIITHVGVMINHKEFLHTRPIIGFAKNSLESSWKRRFRGAIRLLNA